MIGPSHNAKKVKVGFWNVNMGKTSDVNKQLTFTTWVEENKPDILFLEELSESLGGGIPAINKLTPPTWPMVQVGLVNTLDKNFDPSTKCLSVLVRPNAKLEVKVSSLHLEGLDQRRLLLKLVVGGISIWSIHANASEKGGRAAINATKAYLDKYGDAIIGGDFNYPIGEAQKVVKAVTPYSWQNSQLNFSQWKGVDGTTQGVQYHLPSAKVYKKLETHSVIDYVAAGIMVPVAALPNCKTEENWRDVLALFDHCPVLYEITLLK